MNFLRNAVAGVWGLLKPTTAANPVIAETETNKQEIDSVIEKQVGLNTGGIDSKNIIHTNKTNIIQRVVNSKTRRVPPANKEAAIQKEGQEEIKNLNEIDGKVNNSVIANNLAAVANNTNAEISNKLSNDLDDARGHVIDDSIPLYDERITAAAAADSASLFFPAVLASTNAVKADELQCQANDELNRQKYKCLPDTVFEYNEADEQKLTQLRDGLLSKNISTLQFRNGCVVDSAVELAGILKKYSGWAIDDDNTTRISQLMMLRFTESWTPYLSCPASKGDRSVDTKNQIFYNRVTSCLEALGTYSVFLSSPWVAYKATQRVSPAHIAPTPPLPAPAESYYDQVPIPPYRYVIGPILDFQKIEGRIFIYIKCYDDHTYTTGTYFWVYRSQSEGLYRVFFKLIPNDSIEKGYDYTQATLVHFKLQVALCKYYEKHAQRGIKNPIVLNTLSRLNYFVGNMSYLQQPNFLDIFPDRANIIPSFYSIPGEANGVWSNGWSRYPKPGYCDRARVAPPGQAATECCYICLTLPTPTTPAGTFGMIGHYYTIDPKFKPIIHRGFPINKYDGMESITEMTDYQSQFEHYFRVNEAHPNYKFSRHGTQYDATYPYIFCFTTCCLENPCSLFEFFLEPDRYKKTFWCQGFSDFTALMSPTPAISRVLSPVLHVVIGSMLTEPDFYLLSIRYNILNVDPLKSYRSPNPRIDEYRKSTQILMTLGTKEGDRSIYQPSIDPYPRHSAIQAFKSLRDKVNQVNIEYKRRLSSSNEEDKKNQRLLVQDKVQRKIIMIKFIVYFSYTSSRADRDTEVSKIIQMIGGAEQAENIKTKIVELRTKTKELLPPHSRAEDPGYAIGTYSLATIGNTADPAIQEIIRNAIKFIMASPSASATAVIQYLLSPKEFDEDLTDYAILCLKKNWLGGMMDNAYEADSTVFGNPDSRKLYYMNERGEFILMTETKCYNPSAVWGLAGFLPPYLYTSSFDEVKREDTGEYPVTVLTMANIYRLDCYYKKIPGNIIKSMSILFQVSSTIVYTRELNPQILYAMDMQKIPLACLPDLPEANLGNSMVGMVGGTRTKANPEEKAEVPILTKSAAKSAAAAKPAAAAAKPAAKSAATATGSPSTATGSPSTAFDMSQGVPIKLSKKDKILKKKEQQAQQQLEQQAQQQLEQQAQQAQQAQQQIQQQLVSHIKELATRQLTFESYAATLGIGPTQLAIIGVLHTQMEAMLASVRHIETQPLSQEQLSQVQQQLTYQFAELVKAEKVIQTCQPLAQQSQQLAQLAQQQAQQPQAQKFVEQILELEPEKTYLETQATALGLGPIQLPHLKGLQDELESIIQQIQQIQTQPLSPEQLPQIQQQIQQAQQQLPVLIKTYKKQIEPIIQLLEQCKELETRQLYLETQSEKLSLGPDQLPLLKNLHTQVAAIIPKTPIHALTAQQLQELIQQLNTYLPGIQRSQQQIEQIIQLVEQTNELEARQTDIENLSTFLKESITDIENLSTFLKESITDIRPHIQYMRSGILEIATLLLSLHQLQQAQAQTQAAQTQAQLQVLLGQLQSYLIGIQTTQQTIEEHLTIGYLKAQLGYVMYSILFSEYTSCSTHKRVASYGGFFAGKMMDYFFSTYMQLPSFFKYFESYLKICIQYTTTALIYDSNVPPYNLINVDRTYSFLAPFVEHFRKMKIVLVPGSPADGSGNAQYISRILREKTADINAISDFLTKDFMIDTDVLDTVSVVSDGSTLSAASSSTNSSYASQSFCSFDQESMYSSHALGIFLLAAPLEGSVRSDVSFLPDDVPTQQDPYVLGYESPGGGNKPRLTTVATTKRNRKYKSRSSPKRKSKSNNKSKSRHKRNSNITNKTFCRKRKSYLSRKPFKKQTLRKGVKR